MSRLVSAVMITGKNDRTKFAEAAIRSFQAQTYPTKQLVIVTDDVATMERYRTRSFLCPTKVCYIAGPRSLGELRNEGLVQADGEYVVQWDDDDWYHPQRIAYQMQFAEPDLAVVLRYQIRYSFANNAAFVYTQRRPGQGIHGTVLHHRRPGLEYEKIGKHEDSHFLDTHFGDGSLVVVDNLQRPELYVRFHHGLNTWDSRHIMGPYAGDAYRGRWSLPPVASDCLKQILESEYAR